MDNIKCSEMHLGGNYSFMVKNSNEVIVGMVTSFGIESSFELGSNKPGTIETIKFTFERPDGSTFTFNSHQMIENTIREI